MTGDGNGGGGGVITTPVLCLACDGGEYVKDATISTTGYLFHFSRYHSRYSNSRY